MILLANRFRFQPKFYLCIFAFFLGFSGTVSLNATTQELERREARVQATYLTHLINFTRWSHRHLPAQRKAPKILVIGTEKNGFIASVKYLISQTDIEIGGVTAKFIHFNNPADSNVRAELKKGIQVVFLMPNANIDVATVRDLSPSAVIFGFGRNFVTKEGGDGSFVSSRNRVKLVLGEIYFRRTSPKLSSKIANLKSVVEIIREPRGSSSL
jgi:hypothetical protein